ISMLESAEPSFLSCRRRWWPWWGLALPFCRAARNFFMAACSTWPVSFPVFTANAMVFWSTSSCNCYPSFGSPAGRRRDGLNPHPQAGKVVGADAHQIPVLGDVNAGGLPHAAHHHVTGFSTGQPAVVVRKVKADVVAVCLLIKDQCTLFHRAVLLSDFPGRHIMGHKGRIVIPNRGRGVKQRRP